MWRAFDDPEAENAKQVAAHFQKQQQVVAENFSAQAIDIRPRNKA